MTTETTALLGLATDPTYHPGENPLPALLVHWLPVFIPLALFLLIRRVVRRRNAAKQLLYGEIRYRNLIDDYNLTAAAHGNPPYWVPDGTRRTAEDLAWRLACNTPTAEIPVRRRMSASEAAMVAIAFGLAASPPRR